MQTARLGMADDCARDQPPLHAHRPLAALAGTCACVRASRSSECECAHCALCSAATWSAHVRTSVRAALGQGERNGSRCDALRCNGSRCDAMQCVAGICGLVLGQRTALEPRRLDLHARGCSIESPTARAHSLIRRQFARARVRTISGAHTQTHKRTRRHAYTRKYVCLQCVRCRI